MLKACIALVMGAATLVAGANNGAAPTYSKDIAPILNNNCVTCHRPGEIAPMALTSYKEVRPFAKAIKEDVAERKMPPWHADPHVGKFKNERRLSDEQIRTIVRWVDAGAPEGNPRELPPVPKFVTGWTITKPDVEIRIPKPFEVPAEGVVDYQYMIAPTNFTEDKYVIGAEVRPGNREVVHHVIAFVLPPEGATPNPSQRSTLGTQCPQARPTPEQMKSFLARQKQGREPRQQGEHLVGWAPGLQGYMFPDGAAKRIPAGARIMFQLHYTPSGKAATDTETKVGLVFAKGPVSKAIYTLPIMNQQIVIPPNDSNYEAASCFTLSKDLTLLSFMPHMHYRGKDFIYKVTMPGEPAQTVLNVPRYDFNWQTYYELEKPMTLPAGTRIDCTAHFDNSARNKYNPDPSKEVPWGDQTWEEMLIGWITVTTDRPPAVAAATGGGN